MLHDRDLSVTEIDPEEWVCLDRLDEHDASARSRASVAAYGMARSAIEEPSSGRRIVFNMVRSSNSCHQETDVS